ncbi:MAG: CPBP family intramembrane metalloprotease [Anaerolineae bacterium]|nr:CPBP family intramembrane metalloprotease [Anaerolineae bacterium]
MYALVIGIVVAGNLGERSWAWRLAAYSAVALAGAGAILLGLLYLMVAAAQRMSPEAFAGQAPMPLEGLNPVRLGLGLVLGGQLSWLALLRGVRRAVARLIPIRPDSPVNAVALALLILLLAQSIGLGGLGPQGFVSITGRLTVAQVVASELPLAIIGIVGVGLYIRRSPRQTWARLGLQGLSGRQILLTLLGVVGLLAYEVVISAILAQVSPELLENLAQATEELYGGLGLPLAAVAASLLSGTAEEILFRGALQPRFGLLLTAFTFGVVHMQYGLLFALLTTGVVGIVLGLYRQRINTTSAVVIHVLYNLTLFLLAGST